MICWWRLHPAIVLLLEVGKFLMMILESAPGEINDHLKLQSLLVHVESSPWNVTRIGRRTTSQFSGIWEQVLRNDMGRIEGAGSNKVRWYDCICETQPPASIGWVALSSVFRSSRIVTSPLISTIWCFRPYKPYIFCEDMILATCQCHSLLSWAQFTVV